MIWVAIIVMIIDRKWKTATIWAGIGSLFALFGIIHMPEAGFDNFSSPFWEQCQSAGVCWEHGEQWMYFVAYLMLGAFFLIIEVAKRWDTTLKEPIDDVTAHAFDDWFKDAAKETEPWREIDGAKSPEDEEEYMDADPTTKTLEVGEPSSFMDPDYEEIEEEDA